MKKSFFVTIKLVERDSSSLIDILSFHTFSRANDAFKDELSRRRSAIGFRGFSYLINAPKNETSVACLFDDFRIVVSLVIISHS